MSDSVEHPSHYNAGDIETIDAIKSALGDAFLDYCRGNVLKYVWRCRHKGNTLEDLRKAAKHLEWAIEAEAEKLSKAQPLAIPDGWRELNPHDFPRRSDMREVGGAWKDNNTDSDAEYKYWKIRVIRKIEPWPDYGESVSVEEADANASKNEPTEWIHKVGDKVRVNSPGRIVDGLDCVIIAVENGKYTAQHRSLISNELNPEHLELIEAAS